MWLDTPVNPTALHSFSARFCMILVITIPMHGFILLRQKGLIVAIIQGSHKPVKPGIVREFCKPGKVREFAIWSGNFF